MADLFDIIKDIKPTASVPKKEGHWEGWVKPSIKEVTDSVAGTAETIYSLANGMALWPIQKVAGMSKIIAGGTAEDARQTEQQIGEAFSYIPKTRSGKGAGELIGKGFDIALKPARMAGEGIEKLVGPKAGYITELASELAMFKMAHGAGGKAKGVVREVATAKTLFNKKLSQLTKEERYSVNELASQVVTKDLVKKEREATKPELEKSYDVQKDIWLGNRDIRVHDASVESRLLKKEIVGINKELKTKIPDNKIDEVVQLYIDTKRDPSHIEKYYSALPKEKQKLVDLSQNLPDEFKAIADKIEKSYSDIGIESVDAGVLKNMLDDFASRRWDFQGKKGDPGTRKFGTTTGHSKQRKFKTIIEAWADPEFKYELKYKGATDNLRMYKEEMVKTIEDKRFVDVLKKQKDIEGNPLVTSKQMEGYTRIDHPNFKSWEWAGKEKAPEAKPVEATTHKMPSMKEDIKSDYQKVLDSLPENIRKDVNVESVRVAKFPFEHEGTGGRVVLSGSVKDARLKHHIVIEKGEPLRDALRHEMLHSYVLEHPELTEGKGYWGHESAVEKLERTLDSSQKPPEVAKAKEVYGKNFFRADDGTLYERRELYAPEKQAKNLNRILGMSKLYDVPGIKGITKFNDITKAWILQTSLFHHLAFARSYYLGTNHKNLREMGIRGAYKEGLKAVEQGDPALRMGVRNGLTLGLKQDWNEAALRETTRVGRILNKTKGTKTVKDSVNAFREAQADFLFGELGAGLKAKSFLIEMRNQVKKYPNENPNVTSARVARLINDDFGGLHLQRLGRSPTMQHIMRLGLLAPDWTESNIRTVVKTVAKLTGDQRDKHLYRKFWGGVVVKGLGITALMNFVSAGGDIDEMKSRYREAWKAGNMNWAKMDVTPIYQAFGGKPATRKYFSIIGHFSDPAKFIIEPARSLKYKQSVVSGSFYEAMSGTDWKGAKFTTLKELMDEGTTVKWGTSSSIDWEQFPSYALSQIIGWQPIQLQNFIGYTTGEIDGFDALTRSMGLTTSTTYPRKENKSGYAKYTTYKEK